jgi:flagellar motor switch protein FliM
VQWHFGVQFGSGVNTLEVEVQDELFEWVHLHVTQQNFMLCTVEFHVKHGRVKRFFFQCVPQSIVVDFNLQWLSGATVNNTWRTASDAETAARTRALLGALKSDEFHN